MTIRVETLLHSQPAPQIYVLLAVLCLAVFLYVEYGPASRSRKSGIEPSRRAIKSDVPLGDPAPHLDFDINTSLTRNYIYANKPLRFPYFQTMAHQKMHIDHWLELDKDYQFYLDMKKRVIEQQGKTVVDSLPENDEACGELLETVVDYLPKRYPTLFTSLPSGGIHNKITGETFDDTSSLRGVKALKVVSRLVQDDFLMGREREDGHVYFVGGLVAFPGFYLLSEKIGMTLEQAHEPVPYFNEKLLKSVERTLKRFEPNEPFERTSWEIVDDREMFWHNIASLPEGGRISDDLDPKDYIFRMDKQTFRKLPRTKAIIFGVHPIMRRLEQLADSPLIPELLVRIHKESDEKLMKYKVAPAYQEKMIPYLNELTQSQIERGLIQGDENVADFRDLVQSKKVPLDAL
ncbi:hypothetical protein P389DRAFT_186346 [Cystobasidium minutum MCA 4210]|uniref:uncharacterized protein n=1 Tax=Cystobasidium minutum MCA 4210 TaxID=1397322 RepID=UPI0034CFB4ED|eukprot:jgi/Rhomi1/186346/estExt_fgenesh1_pm.C_60034